jgi:hypothetical protein
MAVSEVIVADKQAYLVAAQRSTSQAHAITGPPWLEDSTAHGTLSQLSRRA